MANLDVDQWIPIEWDSEVISRVMKTSAVEAVAQRHTMATATKRILRQGGFTLTGGKTYVDDESDLDYATLTARRFMGKASIDEDDLADTALVVDAIAQRAMDYANSYATRLDNACLGVTGAENGTTVSFTSVYKTVKTTNADLDYTANDNYVNSSGAASASYAELSGLLKLVEDSDYFDEGNAVIIANSHFRSVLRDVKDNDNRPIFVGGQGGDSGQPDQLFGIDIFWSRGAKTSAEDSEKPEGNPLLVFVGDRSLLKLGVRSGPESRLEGSQVHSATDDVAVKFRSRRGFAVGHPKAFAVLEA